MGWRAKHRNRARKAFDRRPKVYYRSQQPGPVFITKFDEPKPKPVAHRFAQTDAFLLSDEWKTLRYRALRRYGARCQCCGRSPKADGVTLHVDHVKPRAQFPELALDLNNLQILCADCNKGKGAWDQTDWREPAPRDLKTGQPVSAHPETARRLSRSAAAPGREPRSGNEPTIEKAGHSVVRESGGSMLGINSKH